jgi:hypothetical protein
MRRVIKNPGAASIPGLKKKGYKKAGPKYGRNTYVKKAPAAPRPPRPEPPTIPYSEYAKYPFAQRQLYALDQEQAAHQGYVGDRVAPWLAASLQGLTGVNPSQPGLNAQDQQQYLANVQGQVGGALNAAATAVPLNAPSLAPGGISASPTAFLSEAARTAAAQRSSAAIQQAQVQSQLNTLIPNTYAQGAVRALADYQAGLPGLYAQRRNEARNKIDEFILTFEENNRRARVQEAISAQNAQTNAAVSLGQLGLSARELEAELNAPAPEFPGNLPRGFVAVPNDEGGFDIERDPTVPAARAPGSGGGGGGGGNPTNRRTPVQIRQKLTATQQLLGPFPRRPKPVKGVSFEQATDGKWYGIRAKASGAAAGSGGANAPAQENLRQELDTWYFDKIDGKFDPPAATRRVGNWILARKGRFTRNGKADRNAILGLLSGVIGGPTIPSGVAEFLDQHVRPDGRWK